MATPPDLSVVIPVFNESSLIEKTLRDWMALFTDLNVSYEFVVVNDGSTDGTGRVLDRLRRDLNHIRVIHQLNMGPLRAIRRGIEIARGQFILQLEANGSVEPQDFPRFWEERLKAKLILGHRTHRLDKISQRLYSTFLRKISKTLFKLPVQDPDVSFRLFDREAIHPLTKAIPLSWNTSNMAISILTQARYSPSNILEIKIPHRKRTLSKKTGFLDLWFNCLQAFTELWQLRRTLKAEASTCTGTIPILQPI